MVVESGRDLNLKCYIAEVSNLKQQQIIKLMYKFKLEFKLEADIPE